MARSGIKLTTYPEAFGAGEPVQVFKLEIPQILLVELSLTGTSISELTTPGKSVAQSLKVLARIVEEMER